MLGVHPASGDQQDGEVVSIGRGIHPVLQLPTDLVAIDSGQHHIEDHQVGRTVHGRLQALLAVVDDLHLVSLDRQCETQGFGDVLLVLHEKDLRILRGHVRTSDNAAPWAAAADPPPIEVRRA